MEMVKRQLSKFTLISLWDLQYTFLRAITSQFFSHQRGIDSYILTQAPGEPKFLITINGHATVRFETEIEIVP